jgi:hypothetical protein
VRAVVLHDAQPVQVHHLIGTGYSPGRSNSEGCHPGTVTGFGIGLLHLGLSELAEDHFYPFAHGQLPE